MAAVTEYFGNSSVYMGGLKLGIALGKMGNIVLPRFGFEVVGDAFGKLAETWDSANKTLKAIDPIKSCFGFDQTRVAAREANLAGLRAAAAAQAGVQAVGQAAGVPVLAPALVQGAGLVAVANCTPHAANMGIASNFFFVVSDIPKPVFFLANLGLYAVDAVIAQGLNTLSGGFALVGMGITLVNTMYKYNIGLEQSLPKTALTIAEKMMDAFAIAFSIGTAFSFFVIPHVTLVILAMNAASATFALTKAWL